MSTININDVEFPSQPSISSLLTSLKRSTLSIHNRLTSILSDAQFTHQAAQSLQRPLIANERCGSWYIRPSEKHASAYFKSTDGHERAWKFSTRRLNLHLVEMIEQHDGVIIVDSTRRGKRMPDALSTTIPVWCAVLNRILLPSHPLSGDLFLPPHLLATTHAQIMDLIPQFVESFRELKLQNLPTLTKPLRPFWVTQDSALPDSTPFEDAVPQGEQQSASENRNGVIFESYRPVICLTASRRTSTSEMDSNGYIQGAADDTENWAHGLTPHVFWANKDVLLSAPEADFPCVIASLQEASSQEPHETVVQLTPYISVCPLPAPPVSDDICLITLTNTSTPEENWIQSPTRMDVGLGKHKTASRNLRVALPSICTFVSSFMQRSPEGRVVVGCESGTDTSVGTALALSCYLFDDEQRFCVPNEDMAFTKTLVKMRLGAIMTAYPGGNPSRQTLQSVNSFLMDWTKG